MMIDLMALATGLMPNAICAMLPNEFQLVASKYDVQINLISCQVVPQKYAHLTRQFRY